MSEWKSAILWGFGTALAHRLVLQIWMGVVWVVLAAPLGIEASSWSYADGNLPVPQSTWGQAILGIWQRWDANHYLNLAQNGYRASDPGPTVFGIFTPVAIKFFDVVTPGSVQVGGIVFATMVFGIALTLLYKVSQLYTNNTRTTKLLLMVTVVLPLSFFYAAPQSDGVYLALTLGFIYCAATQRWWVAAVCGLMAVLARSQGVLLAGIGVLIGVEYAVSQFPGWRERLMYLVRHCWPLVIVPTGILLFELFRHGNNLLPLADIYRQYSYVFFVDPVTGLLLNLRWIVEHPSEAVMNIDIWMLFVTMVLTGLLVRERRWLSFTVYTLGYALVFVTKMNWVWGQYEVLFYTQSFGRYTLALFPLFMWVAEKLERGSRRTQYAYFGLSALFMFTFSALSALGVGPA